MTNKQLNYRLAFLLGLEPTHCDDAIGDNVRLGDGSYVDYCSMWSVTMPIAVKHYVGYKWLMYSDTWIAEFDDGHVTYSSGKSDNPLTAIVKCLIKVLEGDA